MQLVRLGPVCNNACIVCAQAHERASGAARPADGDLLGLIERAAQAGDWVALVGGEPTLHEDMGTWLRRARDARVDRVAVQTNGRRFAYATYARDLYAQGLTAADVSLLGSTAAMHDYHTATPGSFGQTVRGIRHARAAGILVVVSCVITRSNFRHLADLVRVAHGAGASGVRFRFPAAMGRAKDAWARVSAHKPLVEPYLRQSKALAQRLGLDAFLIGTAERYPFVDFTSDGVPDRAMPTASEAVYAATGDQSGRVRPAAAERRVRERKTGEELQEILPKLFSPATGER